MADIRQKGISFLKEHGILEAEIEVWYLIEYCFGVTKTEYFMKQGHILSVPPTGQEEAACRKYQKLLEKRAGHIPLAYLLGRRDFMGFSFKINESVLVPRQETETLVEKVLPYVEGKRVIDVCTGSGCIIISLACLGLPVFCAGTDLSDRALDVARENAEQLGAEVCWYHGDLLEKAEGRFDIIVSNPPYIRSGDIENLMAEVKEYEPRMALDGSGDGLLFYRRLSVDAPKYLTKGGRIFLEIGYDQGKEVSELFGLSGFEQIIVEKDLSGNDRIVSAVWKGKEDV